MYSILYIHYYIYSNENNKRIEKLEKQSDIHKVIYTKNYL